MLKFLKKVVNTNECDKKETLSRNACFHSILEGVFAMFTQFLLSILVLKGGFYSCSIALDHDCKSVSLEPIFSSVKYEDFFEPIKIPQTHITKLTFYTKEEKKDCLLQNDVKILLIKLKSHGIFLVYPVYSCTFYYIWKDSRGHLRAKLGALAEAEALIGFYLDPESGERVYYVIDTIMQWVQQFRLMVGTNFSIQHEINATQEFCDMCLKGNCSEVEEVLKQMDDKKPQTRIVVGVVLVIVILLAVIWVSLEKSGEKN